jgi:hypothetical protein
MALISRPFQLAVKAMVQAQAPTWQYHYGGVQIPSDEIEVPHLVQWPVAARGVIADLGGKLIPKINDVRFVAVGKDVDEVLWGLDQVSAALQGKRPVIDGWGCNFLREIPTEQPVSENKEVLFAGRPTYMGWAQYRMGAEPAPVTASS